MPVHGGAGTEAGATDGMVAAAGVAAVDAALPGDVDSLVAAALRADAELLVAAVDSTAARCAGVAGSTVAARCVVGVDSTVGAEVASTVVVVDTAAVADMAADTGKFGERLDLTRVESQHKTAGSQELPAVFSLW